MATNYEMIEETAMALYGYEFDGANLKTFQEWQKAGYTVKKGEKAFMALDLWKPFEKKLVDENDKPVIDEATGKQKTETRFMLKLSHLFTPEQVEKGVIEKKPKKATGKKKRTYKKKSA